MQRVSELMYGQVLAAMATDGIFYIVICLMATKLCNLLPGIAAIAGQFVMAGIWSAVAHRWYYKAFPPQPTTVVYGKADPRLRSGQQVRGEKSSERRGVPGRSECFGWYEDRIPQWRPQP